MDVSELLEAKSGPVLVVKDDASVEAAARLLATHNIGALVVLGNGGETVGIVSERDIVRSMAELGGRAAGEPIRDRMVRRVITCAPNESIAEVLSRMNANKIRHLPVVDGHALVGMISIRDVTSAWLTAIEVENDKLVDLVANAG